MPDPEYLRLFPLNIILFPGMDLPLKIFEERYKLLIQECIEEDSPFGVVLIKDGLEVGGPARPHRVGTIAQITEVEEGREGRYSLQVVGLKRFRIQEITQEVPYLMGKISVLEDEYTDDLEEPFNKTKDLLSEYWKVIASIKGGWINKAQTPDEPGHLSYTVAQVVSKPILVGQYLLQISSVGERLQLSLPLLQEQLDLAREQMKNQPLYRGPSLN